MRTHIGIHRKYRYILEYIGIYRKYSLLRLLTEKSTARAPCIHIYILHIPMLFLRKTRGRALLAFFLRKKIMFGGYHLYFPYEMTRFEANFLKMQDVFWTRKQTRNRHMYMMHIRTHTHTHTHTYRDKYIPTDRQTKRQTDIDR